MKSIDQLKCWLNGKIVDLKDVHISILDFGFIHSDATYDVMRSEGERILHFDLHMQRFENSCKYFGFDPIQNLKQISQGLIELNKIERGFVWSCVWRGSPPSGNPRDLNAPQNSVVYVKPYYGLKNNGAGLRLAIIEEFCRVPSECYNQNSKNFGWIEFNLSHRRAVSLGYDSSLLLNPSGCLTEGPGFGICFYTGSEFVTPLSDCLNSVTIQVMERICGQNNIPFSRRQVSKNEISSFQCAFACSTSGGVTVIECIDDVKFAQNKSNEWRDFFNTQLSV